MESNKYSKVLTIVLIVIIIGILGILGYFGYTILAEKNTEKKYTEVANEFENMILGGTSSTSNQTGNLSLNSINVTDSSNRKYMEEYEIKGTIEIPKTGLKCPILESTTKRSLQLAVTIMFPDKSDLNIPGTPVVIYGHNYRNSLFFSKNEQLVPGDKIYILDQKTKQKVSYEVYEKFETTSTDTRFYTTTLDNQTDKCEIILSTCTDDASTTDRRIIVRAIEK